MNTLNFGSLRQNKGSSIFLETRVSLTRVSSGFFVAKSTVRIESKIHATILANAFLRGVPYVLNKLIPDDHGVEFR